MPPSRQQPSKKRTATPKASSAKASTASSPRSGARGKASSPSSPRSSARRSSTGAANVSKEMVELLKPITTGLERAAPVTTVVGTIDITGGLLDELLGPDRHLCIMNVETSPSPKYDGYATSDVDVGADESRDPVHHSDPAHPVGYIPMLRPVPRPLPDEPPELTLLRMRTASLGLQHGLQLRAEPSSS